MTDQTITFVAIDFFKPTGFEYYYVVKTEDRGLAVRMVMDLHKEELKYLNNVNARYAGLEWAMKQDPTPTVIDLP